MKTIIKKEQADNSGGRLLRNYTPQELQDKAKGTELDINIQDGKIVMPSKSKEITEMMRFFTDKRYIGPILEKPHITNSSKPIS